MTTQELVERLRKGTGGSLHPFYLACQEAADRLSEMEAEIAKLRTPQWFYNADDGEYTYGDVSDTVDDMGHEGVMLVAGAREVWRKWAAVRCVALDDEGDIDETEVVTFDTEPEALRCWPESFAACRARAALEQQKKGEEL